MMGNVKLGRSIHGYAVKGGFGKEMKFGNTLYDIYSKYGDMDAAMQVFENMDERSVVSWTWMIARYARKEMMGNVKLGRSVHGYAMKGGFGKEMKFGNTLCDIYSKYGDTDAAMQVFENMDERIVVSWTSMIDGYARKGQSDEAIGLFLDMKKERVKPDTFTVTSILHA
nr:pentatricopeptide repeat-containing protein DOT4, chloroplastic [Tanacetum cinerariifolium]